MPSCYITYHQFCSIKNTQIPFRSKTYACSQIDIVSKLNSNSLEKRILKPQNVEKNFGVILLHIKNRVAQALVFKTLFYKASEITFAKCTVYFYF